MLFLRPRLILFILLAVTTTCAAQQTALETSEFEIPAANEGLPGEGPIRRYEWFKDLWKRKRAGWAKGVHQDQSALVFLGDSITQAWGPKLGNAFAGVKVANRGISGDTTRGMLIRLEEDVLALNPSGVVMLMGTNDLEEGAAPKVIASNLERIVQKLKAHNDHMPIVLCTVFPSSASKKRPADDIRELNRLYAQAVRGDRQVTVVDTWTLFADQNGDAKPEEFPDLLHPNRAGYAKWAAALRPILATLDFLERDADDFQIEPGYTSLFNGENLDGWRFLPSSEQDKQASENWRRRDPQAPPWPIVTEVQDFAGKTSTPDGRFVAKRNGRLVVTTPAEGRKIQQLWTQREFPDDFVLKLEFRATPNADSGIFLRGKQLQCRDYSLAGPYKTLAKYKPQDWNEIVVSVRGQSAFCTCNGEVLEADFQIPKDGPIGLEGDRGQIEYRRIRVKEIDGELSRTTPEQLGVSSAAILKFVDALDKIDAVHSFMLLRHGQVISEGWWAPYQPDDPHQLYSLSKSFASTAVGIAVSEGHLTIDDLVVAFFPDELPKEPSAQLSKMRIRDLLIMSTGHDQQDLEEFSFQSDSVLTSDFLALPVRHQPGTHFLYNTAATYMCSAIVQQATGEKLLDYLRPRLFEPLGIKQPTWSESPQGICHGGFGLNLTTEDIARFGQLFLQHGEWNGRQLVSADWVKAATARQTSNGSDPHSDWNQGYGFQFWRCRHNAYRGDGAFGQFCIVVPESDLVLAVTSGTSDMGAVMQQAWNHLLPGIHTEALPPNREANETLHQRLANLKLPLVQGRGKASKATAERFVLADNDQGLSSIEFDLESDQPTITFHDSTSACEIPVGDADWLRSRAKSVAPLHRDRVPTAAGVGIATHGAWIQPDTFHLRLWLYETPYRLDVKFRFDADALAVESHKNVAFGKRSFEWTGVAK